MSLTIGAWIGYAIIAIVILGIGLWVGTQVLDDTKGIVLSIIVAIILDMLVLCGFNWYYTHTATGARAIKTQESELSNGIDRTVTVYDVNGQIIKEYSGHFDVVYDNDRILFDDENGLRHIIYYPTGTVIVDEIGE